MSVLSTGISRTTSTSQHHDYPCHQASRQAKEADEQQKTDERAEQTNGECQTPGQQQSEDQTEQQQTEKWTEQKEEQQKTEKIGQTKERQQKRVDGTSREAAADIRAAAHRGTACRGANRGAVTPADKVGREAANLDDRVDEDDRGAAERGRDEGAAADREAGADRTADGAVSEAGLVGPLVRHAKKLAPSDFEIPWGVLFGARPKC